MIRKKKKKEKKKKKKKKKKKQKKKKKRRRRRRGETQAKLYIQTPDQPPKRPHINSISIKKRGVPPPLNEYLSFKKKQY